MGTIIVIILIIGVFIMSVFMYSGNQNKKMQENIASLLETASEFKQTKTITISDNLIFLIDEVGKKLCVLRPQLKKIYNYNQILDVEYIVNEKTISSKSNSNTIGRALVGGVLAGGAGAIIGGLTGKEKTENLISKIAVKVLFQDLDFPSLTITYFDCVSVGGKPVAADSIYCKGDIERAEDFVNTMRIIIEEGKGTTNRSIQSQPEATPSLNKEKDIKFVADEIKKLASLRDEGILTQEEFEKQKALLLS